MGDISRIPVWQFQVINVNKRLLIDFSYVVNKPSPVENITFQRLSESFQRSIYVYVIPVNALLFIALTRYFDNKYDLS